MKYFKLEELIDQRTFRNFGNTAWQLFTPESLEMLDNFREFIGVPVTVNNWHIGGQFSMRGYRPSWTDVGAINSPHKKGRAFDCDVEGMTAEEVRQKILENQDNPLLNRIMRVEGLVNWVHMDTNNPPEGKKRIYIFKP